MPSTSIRIAASLSRLVLLACLTVLAGCASRPSDPAALAAFEEINDRYEPLNRTLFDIDQALDAAVIRPIAWTYREITPKPMRDGVSNALANFRSPITFVNDVLQGEPGRAATTLWRLVINSTVGIGGLFDAATKLGVPGHTEDFGQTLAVWGVGSGNYLYLPILGPSGFRDGIGLAVDSFAIDPLAWYSYNPRNDQSIQWYVLGAVLIDVKADTMAATDELKKSSIDYYAAFRSAYRQIREREIRNGAPDPADGATFDAADDPFAPEKPQ